ncbi:hypothetical protein ACFXHA_17300 [Nocardia sp. NPDC059240]|uniref:hypothetical protein n=1 Tax=Nocardia sp. NPDC059240 TaxID=3346786 RepID=UPI0036A46EC2
MAIAAHGFEGELPHSSALALLLLISGAVGAAVGSPAGRGPVRLFAALGTGQLLVHSALTVATGPAHPHGTPEGLGATGAAMLTAHIAATVLCVLLITAVERLYAAVSRVLWTLLSRFDPLPADRDRVVLAARAIARRHRADLLCAITLRGPPTLLAS